MTSISSYKTTFSSVLGKKLKEDRFVGLALKKGILKQSVLTAGIEQATNIFVPIAQQQGQKEEQAVQSENFQPIINNLLGDALFGDVVHAMTPMIALRGVQKSVDDALKEYHDHNLLTWQFSQNPEISDEFKQKNETLHNKHKTLKEDYDFLKKTLDELKPSSEEKAKTRQEQIGQIARSNHITTENAEVVIRTQEFKASLEASLEHDPIVKFAHEQGLLLEGDKQLLDGNGNLLDHNRLLEQIIIGYLPVLELRRAKDPVYKNQDTSAQVFLGETNEDRNHISSMHDLYLRICFDYPKMSEKAGVFRKEHNAQVKKHLETEASFKEERNKRWFFQTPSATENKLQANLYRSTLELPKNFIPLQTINTITERMLKLGNDTKKLRENNA